MTKVIQTLAGLKTSLSFVLHLLAMIALYSICLIKGIDTSNVIMMVALSYGGTQTAKQISAHVNASRDPECSTSEVIYKTNEK